MANFLAWLTTNHNCNLRCGWCYQREMAKSKKVMDYQLAKKLIGLCSGLPVKNVILIGGEPTLHPRFFDIARCIKGKNLVTNVVSNSIKFADDEFVRKSEDAGVEAVTTSIKGSSEAEYLKATGYNAFSLVRKAIENLENSGIAQQISVTVSSSTIANWDKMVSFVRECGAKNFNFSFEKPTILSNGITFDDRMMLTNIACFIQDVMYPSLLETGVNFKMEMMFPQCVLRDGFVQRLEDECHVFGGCLLINKDGIVFDPDGFVLPCNHFVTYPLGRFGKEFETPDEFLAWRNSGETSRFYQISKLAPGDRCAKCDKWSKCGAGCRLYWLYRGPNELLPVLGNTENGSRLLC